MFGTGQERKPKQPLSGCLRDTQKHKSVVLIQKVKILGTSAPLRSFCFYQHFNSGDVAMDTLHYTVSRKVYRTHKRISLPLKKLREC